VQLIQDFKQRVRHLKSETFALHFASRHPATPRYAKALVVFVVAYAFKKNGEDRPDRHREVQGH
jgi:uncharacterized membrane protein YkvA (DUF1232 family)